MRQFLHTLVCQTDGQKLYNTSAETAGFGRSTGMTTGLLTLCCRDPSALLIQENAGPVVDMDVGRFFASWVPDSGPYLHAAEGGDDMPAIDDMPAHIRSALRQSTPGIPGWGRRALGTWQAIYLVEPRRKPHRPRGRVAVLGV
jgi:secondary thiamine-phosphate synthase enzyme